MTENIDIYAEKETAKVLVSIGELSRLYAHGWCDGSWDKFDDDDDGITIPGIKVVMCKDCVLSPLCNMASEDGYCHRGR